MNRKWVYRLSLVIQLFTLSVLEIMLWYKYSWLGSLIVVALLLAMIYATEYEVKHLYKNEKD